MTSPSRKLFLTGEPGVGKTTLIRLVVEKLRASTPMTGFLTEEVREQDRRRGFAGRTLDGRSFLLADVGPVGPFRLGSYHVTLEGLEAIGLPALTPGPDTRLVVLDEVGKMESFSLPFRERVERLLASDIPVLASVALHGVGFVKRVRHDPRITLIHMKRDSREGLVGELLRRLALLGIGPAAARSRLKDEDAR